MKILVLDDDLGRLSQFKQRLIGHVVCCVETAPEAIRKLSEELFDLFFTDHDLGGQVYQESGPGTGYEVAKWLVEHIDRKPNQIIIHSLNRNGALNIQSLLPDAKYIPGVWTKIEV